MLAAARLPLVGCALLAVLALGGCGGGGSDPSAVTDPTVSGPAITTTTAEAVAERREHEQPAAGPCQSRLGGFVASMDSLRRRLAVGVTFDQYLAEVRGIRSTYRRIPIERVEIDCLATVGTPAEKAFNRYIEAANDWGDCVSEAGCSSETVEPVLQRHWRIASHFLGEADDGLDALSP
ncbi:MAG TPA: hypothetical protein VFJ76_04270 [Solirubrobacterales bacterium]|nr:hypothetical protein [Solirubrobacterales bacterium]